MSENSISTARYDGYPDTGGDFTDQFAVIAYHTVMRQVEGLTETEFFDEGMTLTRYGLRLSCSIKRVTESRSQYSALMMFLLSHELFDEPVCEFCAGHGGSAEEAIINGTGHYIVTVLTSVFSAFDHKGEKISCSDFDGRERVFYLSSEPVTYSTGDAPEQGYDMFSMIKGEIPAYLGSKRAYWVAMRSTFVNGKRSCTVRINGAVMNDLSAHMKKMFPKEKGKDSYESENQFVLMINDSDTVDREYFPPEKVIGLTKKAIKLFGEANDADEDYKAYSTLCSICEDNTNFVLELRFMMPQLFILRVLDIRYGDKVKLLMGDIPVYRMRSQLRYLGYIEQGIEQFMAENTPDMILFENLLLLSGLREHINQLQLISTERIDYVINQLIFLVPEDYEML